MANSLRAENSVTINGKTYTMRASFDAVCEFENAIGKSCFSIIKDLGTGESLTLRVIAAAIWAGIRGAAGKNVEKTPSLEDIGRSVFSAGSTKFLGVVLGFINASLMSEEEIRAAEETAKNG